MTNNTFTLNTANYIEDEDGLDSTNASGIFSGKTYKDHDDSLVNGALKFKVPVSYNGHDTLKYSFAKTVTVSGHTFSITNNNDGTFSLDKSQFQYLNANEAIKLTISVTVSDGCHSICGSTTVTIVGTDDNHAPCVQDVCYQDDEDGISTVAPNDTQINTRLVFGFNGSDQDHDALTYHIKTGTFTNGGQSYTVASTSTAGTYTVTNAGQTFTIKDLGNGKFEYLTSEFQYLNQGQTRTLVFQYNATDSHGANSGTATASVKIYGTDDNHAPCSFNVSYHDDEDGLNTVTPNDTQVEGRLVFGFNATDADAGDALTYHVKTGTFTAGGQSYTVASTSTANTFTVTNAGQTFTVKDLGNGKFEYLTSEFQYLNAGQTRTVVLQYTATDSHGGTSNVSTATTVIYGTDDNHTPTGTNVSYQDDEDGLAAVNPNDTEINTRLVFSMHGTDADGDALTYAIKTGTFTSGGQSYTVTATATAGTYTVTNAGQTFTIKDLGNGHFEYLTSEFQYLNNGQTRTLVFQYTANDGHGHISDASTATVTIHGTDDNQCPTVKDITVNEDEDGSNAVLPNATLVENKLIFGFDGTDPNGDAITYHVKTGTFTDGGVSYTVANTATAGTYTITTGGQTFTVKDLGNGQFELLTSEYQSLNTGDIKTLKFQYDGTSSHGVATTQSLSTSNTVTGTAGDQHWGDLKLVAHNWDGGVATAQMYSGGIGINGDRFDTEIDHKDSSATDSESLSIEFPSKVSSADLTLNYFYNGAEGSNSDQSFFEVAVWKAYDMNGNLVGSGELHSGDGTHLGDGNYKYHINLPEGTLKIVLSAGQYSDTVNGSNGDSSDYALSGITYTTDNDCISNTGTVTVNIHGTDDNHAPTIQNVSYQDDEDALNSVNPNSTEIENRLVFSMHGSDADAGDAVTYHVQTGTFTNGGESYTVATTSTAGTYTVTNDGKTFTVKDLGNGKFEYLTSEFQYLNPGETKTLIFQYNVTDTHGATSGTATATVTIYGTDDNHTPSTVNVAYQDDEDGLAAVNPNDTEINTRLVFSMHGTDADAGDTLTYHVQTGTFTAGGQSYTVASTATAGTYTVTNAGQTFTIKDLGNGHFEYLTSEFQYLNQGQTRTLVFQYDATDGHGGTSAVSTATVTIYGTDDNQCPVVKDVVVNEDEDASAAVLPNETLVADHLVFGFDGTDANGDVITYHIQTGTFTSGGQTYTVANTATAGTYSVTNNGQTFTVQDLGNGKFELLTSEFQYLNTGDIKTLKFQYNGTSGHGTPYSQTLTTANTVTGTAGDQHWGDLKLSATDWDGHVATAQMFSGGIGVVGDRFDTEIDHKDNTATDSETLSIVFPQKVSSTDVTLNYFYTGEQGHYEVAIWKAYDMNGNLVGSGALNAGDGTTLGSGNYKYHINLPEGTLKIVLSAGQYDGSVDGSNGDSSDYALSAITYTTDNDCVSNTGTVTVNIHGTDDNHTPVTINVAYQDDEDGLNTVNPSDTEVNTRLVFSMHGTDSDGDTLTYHIQTGTFTDGGQTYTVAATATAGTYTVTNAGQTFTVKDNGGGHFEYLTSEFQYLNNGEHRTLEFQYTATDGHGGTSGVSTATTTIYGTNGSPVAVDDFANIHTGDTATLHILANDTDPDGDDLDVSSIDSMTINGVTIPAAQYSQYFTIDTATGQLVFNSSTINVPAGTSTSVLINYTDTDHHGGSASAVVHINIAGDDVNLIASNQQFIDDEDAIDGTGATAVVGGNTVTDHDDGLPGSLKFTINNFTYNGSHAVTVSGVPATVSGSDGHVYHIADNGNGTFTLNTTEYQHLAAGQAVTLTFNYTATDGTLSSVAEAKVIVIGTNDGPTAVDDFANIHTGDTTTLHILSNDTDPDGDDLDVSSINSMVINGVTIPASEWAHYFAINNATGDLTFSSVNVNTPAGTTSTVLINYTDTDHHGGSASAVVHINIVGDDVKLIASDQQFIDDEDAIDGTGATAVISGNTVTDHDDGLPGALKFTINNISYNGSAAVTIGNAPATVVGSDGHTYHLTNNGNGTFTLDTTEYQHLNAGEAVTLTFNYTATDGTLSSTAAAKVVIIGTNDAPKVIDVAYQDDEDASNAIAPSDTEIETRLVFSMHGTDSDTGDTLTYHVETGTYTINGQSYTVAATATAGTYNITNNGQTFTLKDIGGGHFEYLTSEFQYLNNGENRVLEFHYNATDSHGATSADSTAKVTIYGNDDTLVTYYGDSANENISLTTATANAQDVVISTAATISGLVKDYISNTQVLDYANAYGDHGNFTLSATAGNATTFAHIASDGGTEYAKADTTALIENNTFNFGNDTITVNHGLIVGDVGNLSLFGHQGNANAQFDPNCFDPTSDAKANVKIDSNTFNFGSDNLKITNGDVVGDVQQLSFTYENGTASGNGTTHDDDNWNFGNTFNFGNDTIAARTGTLTGDLAKVVVNGTTYDLSVPSQLTAFQATTAYTANTFHFGSDTFKVNANDGTNVAISDFGIGGVHDKLDISGTGGTDVAHLVAISNIVNDGSGHIQLNIDVNNDGIIDSSVTFKNISFDGTHHEITDYLSAGDIITHA